MWLVIRLGVIWRLQATRASSLTGPSWSHQRKACSGLPNCQKETTITSRWCRWTTSTMSTRPLLVKMSTTRSPGLCSPHAVWLPTAQTWSSSRRSTRWAAISTVPTIFLNRSNLRAATRITTTVNETSTRLCKPQTSKWQLLKSASLSLISARTITWLWKLERMVKKSSKHWCSSLPCITILCSTLKAATMNQDASFLTRRAMAKWIWACARS